jgi:hypothetical protein
MYSQRFAPQDPTDLPSGAATINLLWKLYNFLAGGLCHFL